MLFYAMYRVTNQARGLRDKYMAGFDVPTEGTA